MTTKTDGAGRATPAEAESPAARRTAMFERFREYKRTGSRAIRNELVEAHLDVAEFYVKRYRGRGVPADDLRQVALLTIVRAVDRFDPDMEVEFRTFASRTIELTFRTSR